MSSTIDQRLSKGHDHRGGGQQSVQEVEYTYPPQAVAVQGGYHPNSAPLGQPAGDPYAMYGGYEPYMQFPAGLMSDQGGVWSTADPNMAAISYGGYSTGTLPGGEYLSYTDGTGEQYGGAPTQYDYSAISWFPAGVDYGAAWGQGTVPMQPQQQQHRSRISDYSNSYYDMPVDSVTGAPGSVSGPTTVGSYGEMNGAHAVDHAFKSMKLSPDDDGATHGGEERASSVGASGEGGRFNGGQDVGGNASSSQKKSWANVASQPAKTILLRPKNNQLPRGVLAVSASVRQESLMNANSGGSSGNANGYANGNKNTGAGESGVVPAVLSQGANQYNPKEFDVSAKNARFFVIKSFSEDDIHRSIKFSIWCSTEYGNKRLDGAYREREGKGPVYLLFSVNGSGHFCGVAVMTSAVDYHSSSNVWAQNKWKGQFSVSWIFVKDVPNSQLRHIRLENNEGKPVTNSRDTQEVPPEKGRQVLRIIHQYRHTTSIFDDFSHYEKQLEESSVSASAPTASAAAPTSDE